jgi:hypothetical protein
MSGPDVITTVGPVTVAAFQRVCRTCGNPVRPRSLICVRCGAPLGRVPKVRQGSMVIPAIILLAMALFLVAYLANSLGA